MKTAPVLIGITVDESMFLLHAMRAPRDDGPGADPSGPIAAAIRAEGRAIAYFDYRRWQ